MSNYECVVLARPDLATTQVEALQQELASIVGEGNGAEKKREYWGIRNLAYRLRKVKRAHYFYSEITIDRDGVAELDRRLRLNEDILRHLIVKVENLSEGPSAILRAKEKEERMAQEFAAGGHDENDTRDKGYRPRPSRRDSNDE